MITAYAFVGDRLEPLPAEQLAQLRTLPPHVVWIDLLSPTAEEEQRVELPTREEMEEIEVSARLYQEDGAEFMTMTAVTRMDSEEPITTAITFALKHSALITLRYADTRAFTNVVTRGLKPHGIPCADGEQVMLALIDALCDRVADALENVGRDIDSLSRGIFRRRVEEKASVTTQDLQRTIRRIGQDGDLLTKVRAIDRSAYDALRHSADSRQPPLRDTALGATHSRRELRGGLDRKRGAKAYV